MSRAGSTSCPALPGVPAEIEELVGREAALALALEFGGERIYFPRPGVIDPDHPIYKAVGP